MAAPVYKTKGELRSILLTRLGYGGLGASAGAFVPMVDDLLDEAQEQLYELLVDNKRTRTWDQSLGSAQQWLDIPSTCDVDKISGVYVLVDTTWKPLNRGIDYSMDSTFNDTSRYPSHYDIRYNASTAKAQIEIWPKNDAVRTIRVEGHMQLSAFVADADKSSFDHRLILLYAVAYGKLHLNKPDAKAAMDAWTVRLRMIKASQHGQNKYMRGNPRRAEEPTPAPPRVV